MKGLSNHILSISVFVFSLIQSNFQRQTSYDLVRKIVQEEGREARNLIQWNVPVDDEEHRESINISLIDLSSPNKSLIKYSITFMGLLGYYCCQDFVLLSI